MHFVKVIDLCEKLSRCFILLHGVFFLFFSGDFEKVACCGLYWSNHCVSGSFASENDPSLDSFLDQVLVAGFIDCLQEGPLISFRLIYHFQTVIRHSDFLYHTLPSWLLAVYGFLPMQLTFPRAHLSCWHCFYATTIITHV